jgi:hypothetical protein
MLRSGTGEGVRSPCVFRRAQAVLRGFADVSANGIFLFSLFATLVLRSGSTIFSDRDISGKPDRFRWFAGAPLQQGVTMALFYYQKAILGITGIPAQHSAAGSTLAYYRPRTFSPCDY